MLSPWWRLEVTFRSVVQSCWPMASVHYYCELVEGWDCVWFISGSWGPTQEKAGSGPWGNLYIERRMMGLQTDSWGLSDERAWSCLFRTFFRATISRDLYPWTSKWDWRQISARGRGVELKKKVCFYSKQNWSISGDWIPPKCLSQKVMQVNIQGRAN